MMKPISGSCSKRGSIFTVAVLALATTTVHGATFGTAVRLGGTTADIALDEARGVLYVANFGASRIDVVSLATRQAGNAIAVAPYPSSLALSPDGQFLLVAQFGNFQAPSSPANALTEIDLTTGGQQTFTLGDVPLAVAFGADGLALVVTNTEFLLLDPVSGGMQVLNTIAGVTANTLPVPPATFPPQIVAASVGVSGDGRWIFGLTNTIYFRYDVLNHLVTSVSYSAVPPQGPSVVSVSQDGSYFTAGWGLFNASGLLISEFANPSGQLNMGSHVIDSVAGVIYAQIPQAQSQSGTSGSSATVGSPVLMVVDADNLTVRNQLQLPENLTGKSLLNKARNTVYSVSESGVVILPVGSLQQAHQLAASREDVLFLGNYCQQQASTQILRSQIRAAMRRISPFPRRLASWSRRLREQLRPPYRSQSTRGFSPARAARWQLHCKSAHGRR
jgi:DNA-binding beta-propeller fold protein YncE